MHAFILLDLSSSVCLFCGLFAVLGCMRREDILELLMWATSDFPGA